MATTIPLRCNICPQEPDFSDLSHLLTHVSSKGHLSHHLKAQLRGRHNEDIRQKLNMYDQWYERYNIEKLLSQRLSAKASKQDIEKERGASAKPTRRSRACKSRPKASTSLKSQRSPVTNEPAIDPQLSNSHVRPQHGLDLPFHPTHHDHGGKRQTYVPRMSDWQIDTLAGSHQTSYTPNNAGSRHSPRVLAPEKDADDEYFRSFIRSPASAEYPDLPELKKSFPMSQPLKIDEQAGRLQAFRARALFQDDHKNDEHHEVDPLHSPILKGVRWPGMSLFDSASLESQRLRNQKKDRSILEQMAHNSTSVEQMEDIYWPDGSLKKRRLITGNVDSSPTSQPSPVPKRPRRARTNKPRSVLADLSINGRSEPKKHGRKSKVGQTSSHTAGNENSSEARFPYSDIVQVDYHPSTNLTNADEKPLIGDSPSIQPPRRSFQVFKDINDQSPLDTHHGLGVEKNRFDTSLLSRSAGVNPGALFAADGVASLDWYNELRSYVKTPTSSGNSENLPSQPKPQAQAEHLEGSAGRVMQRYFSVTGDEEPQFFDSMPPQMEFGGTAGPSYRGATLNPLNPYFHARQPRSPRTWASSACGPRVKDNGQYQGQLVLGGSALKRKASELTDF